MVGGEIKKKMENENNSKTCDLDNQVKIQILEQENENMKQRITQLENQVEELKIVRLFKHSFFSFK